MMARYQPKIGGQAGVAVLAACAAVGLVASACDKRQDAPGQLRAAAPAAADDARNPEQAAPRGDAEAAGVPAIQTRTEPPEGMVLIPGGTFMMGPPEELTGGRPPVRTTVAPFLLDRLEVSTAAYLACLNAGRCERPEHTAGCNLSAKKPLPTHPANCVTQPQAAAYCAQLGKRLPSEAEWELAARGTDGRAYPWGNEPPTEQLCWQRGANSEKRRTCPVGNFPDAASPFGVLDMAGNVAEWTATEDREAAGAGAFVLRGGGYQVDELASPEYYDVRADKSDSRADTRTDPNVGFRCAKSLAR